jgi:hypothetical protein
MRTSLWEISAICEPIVPARKLVASSKWACRDWDCHDCGVNTFETNEYYMVHDEVWLSAGLDKKHFCCFSCLEKRLGRPMVLGDFTPAVVNMNIQIGYELGLRASKGESNVK